MKNQRKSANIIRWIARIWGSLILAFLLFFLLLHIFGNDESGEGFRSATEIITFICFPISAIVGLGLAWKWEGLGGLITVLGMIIFGILRPEMIINIFTIAILIPGLLFIIYWFLLKKQPEIT